MNKTQMEHPFNKLNTILSDNLKYLDKDTIKEANKLLNEVYVSLIENRKDKRIICQEQKYLLCIEVLGTIPRYYRLLTIDFLQWLQVRIIKVDNILYWQAEYEEFIYFVKRKPNTFKELESFSKVDSDTRTKIMISKLPEESKRNHKTT